MPQKIDLCLKDWSKVTRYLQRKEVPHPHFNRKKSNSPLLENNLFDPFVSEKNPCPIFNHPMISDRARSNYWVLDGRNRSEKSSSLPGTMLLFPLPLNIIDREMSNREKG